MRSFPSYVVLVPSLVAVAAALAPSACNPDTTTGFNCGPGTVPSGDLCVPAPDAGEDAPATPPVFAGVNAVAPISPTSLFVSWLPASDAQTPPNKMVYRVYASNAPGGENFKSPITTSAPGATHVEVNGLAPAGSTWSIVVRALNVAGLEDDNKVEITTQAATDTNPPTFGGASAAAPDVGGAVKVSWDPPATDDHTPKEAIEYLVFQNDVADPFPVGSPIAISDPGASSMVIKGLPDPKASYFFIVRARDAAGNIEKNKKIVNSKPGPDTTPPVFAGCTGAVAKDAGSIAVTWAAASDDVSPVSAISYDLYASTTPGGENFATPNNTYTGMTSGVVTGLSPGTKWFIVCRAKDATGNEDKNVSEVGDTTKSDSTPPVFAGVASVDGVAADGATLHWAAATDNLSDPADIVYVVYQRDKDVTSYPTTPAATSKPGVTSFAVTGLSSAKDYCWKVHAKDGAGNEDTNTAEQCASTLVSFEKGVQPIFTLHCAVTGCHVGPSPTGGMVLADGFAYSYTVNVTSGENPPMKRIAPSDPTNSYLYQKITGHPAGTTSPMPPPSTGDVLSDAEKNTILQWILEGAPNN